MQVKSYLLAAREQLSFYLYLPCADSNLYVFEWAWSCSWPIRITHHISFHLISSLIAPLITPYVTHLILQL